MKEIILYGHLVLLNINEMSALRIKKQNATRIMVDPVADLAHSSAEIKSPANAEDMLTSIAHQNILPADRERFLAVAAGTINIAVTNIIPIASTERTTNKDKSKE